MTAKFDIRREREFILGKTMYVIKLIDEDNFVHYMPATETMDWIAANWIYLGVDGDDEHYQHLWWMEPTDKKTNLDALLNAIPDLGDIDWSKGEYSFEGVFAYFRKRRAWHFYNETQP